MSSRVLGWDDLDKRRFYSVGPVVFLGVRVITHPMLVLKTRVQVWRRACSRRRCAVMCFCAGFVRACARRHGVCMSHERDGVVSMYEG
jgi:hypothetical protein